jgi:ribonucleotide monophosphatase NagD (HAD superfamily)
MSSSSMSGIRALLVDLSGTLHVENEAIPGAVDAVGKIREKKIPIKFVTNTTKVNNDHDIFIYVCNKYSCNISDF